MKMEYKVVPFVAKITQQDTTANVAAQLETLINKYSSQGWEYVRLENVETHVAPDSGCFGLGGKPGYSTSYKMAVFKK